MVAIIMGGKFVVPVIFEAVVDGAVHREWMGRRGGGFMGEFGSVREALMVDESRLGWI